MTESKKPYSLQGPPESYAGLNFSYDKFVRACLASRTYTESNGIVYADASDTSSVVAKKTPSGAYVPVDGPKGNGVEEPNAPEATWNLFMDSEEALLHFTLANPGLKIISKVWDKRLGVLRVKVRYQPSTGPNAYD